MKQLITADELNWRISEALKSFQELPPRCDVAIIPVGKSRWIAVTAAGDRKRHSTLNERVQTIQTGLQAIYGLRRS